MPPPSGPTSGHPLPGRRLREANLPRGDRIGLGTGSMCLGEPARLQRVHLDQRKRLAKRCLEGLVIRPCWLENNPRNRSLAQPFGQSAKPHSRIIEALRRTIFQPESVQMGFRNPSHRCKQRLPGNGPRQWYDLSSSPCPMLVMRGSITRIRSGPLVKTAARGC